MAKHRWIPVERLQLVADALQKNTGRAVQARTLFTLRHHAVVLVRTTKTQQEVEDARREPLNPDKLNNRNEATDG